MKRHDTRLTAALGALLLTAAAVTVAAEPAGEHRSIAVTGHGEARGAPDMATINAGVQTRAPAVIEASQQNQAIVERLIDALDAKNVEPRDIQTADYSIWPEQRSDPNDTGNNVITGYTVNNTVHVTVRELDRIGELLAAVTDAGANTIHGISFGIEDDTVLEARAREAAMEDARRRADALAKLAGVELGEVRHISMSSGGWSPFPGNMMSVRSMDAAPEPGIMSGELSVSVELQVTYAIR